MELRAAAGRLKSSTMARPVRAIVMPPNAKQAPHTEERLPWNGMTSPGATPQPAAGRLDWIPAPVNLSVWTMPITDAKKSRAGGKHLRGRPRRSSQPAQSTK
jgi:hypothetical protein